MSGEHTARSHADCSEVLLRIFEYLDGELETDEVTRIASHLRECGPCLEEHDLDRTLKAVVRRACGPQPAPPALRLSILRSITVHYDGGGWAG